jgi:hypothetical protein
MEVEMEGLQQLAFSQVQSLDNSSLSFGQAGPGAASPQSVQNFNNIYGAETVTADLQVGVVPEGLMEKMHEAVAAYSERRKASEKKMQEIMSKGSVNPIDVVLVTHEASIGMAETQIVNGAASSVNHSIQSITNK